MIAHGWSDNSVNLQSKALALAFSKNNKVIFLSSKKSGTSVLQINENLVVYEWPGKRPVGWKDFFFAFKKMKQYRPDIIVTNFAANDIMLFTSWLLRVKTRVCYFHTLVRQHIADHGHLGIRQRINIFRKGFAFRRATHMLALSHAGKEDLLKYYQVKKKHIFLFANALPDTAIRNNHTNKSIGFLGRLDHSKGVDILMDAFKKIAIDFPTSTLIITGKGTLQKELMEKIVSFQLSGRIFMNDVIPYEEVQNFLATHYFLVVPSRMDNLPTVALEALSVGTPVIASDAGGLPDIVEDGYNGLLFENENVNMLAEKMKCLLDDEGKRNEMSVNARKTFEKKYCMDDLAERFIRMLNIV